MATIQFPVLFDMSGDTIVFGEEAGVDFVSSHLDFLLDMTTEVNDISLNAADISGGILIGDTDNSDNIFYSGGTNSNTGVDNLCNRIAKAVTRGKLVHTPKSGNTSNSGIPMGGRANIYKADGTIELPPDGKYAIKYNTSVSPIGDEQMLGQAMARIASIHLVGSPLAAGIFTDKNQIQTDLETASAQTFNSGATAFYNALAVQLSKVLGGSKSTTPMKPGGRPKTYTVVEPSDYDINKTVPARLATAAENQLLTDLVPSLRIVTGNSNAIFHTYHFQGPWATGPKGYYAIDLNTTATDNKYELAFNTHATPTGTGSEGGAYGQNNWGIHINAPLGTPLDASGVANPALKSIYEQLMNVPGRSQIMQTRDISGVVDNSNTTLAGGFPFIAGDKLVMYLRPKIVFAAQTSAEQTTSLIGFTSAPTLDAPVFNVGRSGQGITGQTYNQSDHYPPANADTYKGLKAFDGTVTGTYGWLANNPFNTTTGAYTGSVTTSVDGANILGSWVEVNVGKKVAVNNYKIYPQNHEIQTIGSRSPHIFKLVYSNDGTNFITADSQTVGTGIGDTSQWATSNDGSATYIPKTFTLTENTVGQYWRLLVTSVYGGLGGGGALGIQELELRGVDSFTEKGDVSGGAISDISGLITNVIATAADIQTAFPGNATTGPEAEALKWGWMGSANSDSLSLDTTDEQSVRTCDLHIWKITITL